MLNPLSNCLVGTLSLLWAITSAAQVQVERSAAPQHASAAVVAPQGSTAASTGARVKPSDEEPAEKSPKGAMTYSLREFELGNVFFEASEWNTAIEKYQKAAESPDEKVAAAARRRLALALARRNAEPLGLRQWLPSPINHWRLLDYTTLLLLAFIFLPLVLKLVSLLSRTFIRAVKPAKATSNWRVVLSGSAEQLEQCLLFDELVITLNRLKILRQDFAGREIAALGGSFRQGSFFYPISLTALVEPGITVRGVDIGRLAAFLQALIDHYSYRLEIRVDRYAGSPYVFACLKWGAYTEDLWQMPAMGSDPALGSRELGRQLAYDICGRGMVRQ